MQIYKLMIIELCLIWSTAASNETKSSNIIDYAGEMRKLISEIADYARMIRPHFLIIPNGGVGVVMKSEQLAHLPTSNNFGQIDVEFIKKVPDGWTVESLLYGENGVNTVTSTDLSVFLLLYINRIKSVLSTLRFIVIDYCTTVSLQIMSYAKNTQYGHLSYSSDITLSKLPSNNLIFGQNDRNITSLKDARNILFVINPNAQYKTKDAFLSRVNSTNYDVIVLSPYFDSSNLFTESEIRAIKRKRLGGKRLIVCYLNIGEAEQFLPYWQSGWSRCNGFIDDIDSDSILTGHASKDHYKIKYWHTDWKTVMLYETSKLLFAGCDGAFLDNVDTYYHFESASSRCK